MGKVYVGSRLRQLRRERDLSQAALAEALGLSASYVNQIEHDVRPLTVAVLARVTETFGVDAAFFSSDDDSRLVAEVRDVVLDQELGARTPDMQELSEFVRQHPGIARTFVEMHRRYRNVSDKLSLATDTRRLPDDAHGEDSPGGRLGRRNLGILSTSMPHEEVRDFFYTRRNYIDTLDRAAEDTAAELSVRRFGVAELAETLARRLNERHGVDIEYVDPAGGVLHSFDPETLRLRLSRLLDPGQAAFRMAAELAHLEQSPLIEPLLDDDALTGEDSRNLARRGLGLYYAAALTLPYRLFHAEAERTGYDVELLCHTFGLGYETVASRLSTLQRPRLTGVPFTFIRVDRAGNVSKRQSATSFHLTQAGGTCPLWNVYDAFSQPRRISRQFAQMPDGRTYLWIARTVRHHQGAFNTPGKLFVIGLGCETRHAHRTAYAEGFNFDDVSTAARIGTGCRVCTRAGCPQRAFPPIQSELSIDPHRSSIAPY